MPSRLRKTGKLLGHVSHSHPSTGTGVRRMNFDKYHPGYFGEAGGRHHHLKRKQSFCPTVNLDELCTLVSEQTRGHAAKNKTGAAPSMDVVRSATAKFWARESSKAACHCEGQVLRQKS
ncbi:hypothetical protein QTO34_001448 [Cnephaeus nilssonii]|uniref:Large ribosomal subunit protein uL15 n=1 Tax=Cnephaeus nilssonii TaxID=3371016 RepID=A0AA40HW44_CNENI|nr:hypothetical protein QTO34_001448 [Eptesicus nilssonii]